MRNSTSFRLLTERDSIFEFLSMLPCKTALNTFVGVEFRGAHHGAERGNLGLLVHRNIPPLLSIPGCSGGLACAPTTHPIGDDHIANSPGTQPLPQRRDAQQSGLQLWWLGYLTSTPWPILRFSCPFEFSVAATVEHFRYTLATHITIDI